MDPEGYSSDLIDEERIVSSNFEGLAIDGACVAGKRGGTGPWDKLKVLVGDGIVIVGSDGEEDGDAVDLDSSCEV